MGLLADQATKIAAVHYLGPGESIRVVGRLFSLTLVRNPGAAFSTGTTLTPFITAFAIAALAVVVVLSRRVGDLAWAWALGLLMAGIVGNLVDRMARPPGPFRGHVVDFLHLTNWPVFNVADILINIAAVLIVIQSLRGIPLRGPRPVERSDAPGATVAPPVAGDEDEQR